MDSQEMDRIREILFQIVPTDHRQRLETPARMDRMQVNLRLHADKIQPESDEYIFKDLVKKFFGI
jgi:hypothetical protein